MSQTEVQLIKDAVIVNADVSNSAAIDVSKISGAMPLAGGSFTDDVTFTGASANVTFDKSSNEFLFADNAKASFGNNGDMVIKHTGSNSLIEDVGQGNLEIQTNSSILLQKGNSEFLAKFISDGAVELYHDNTKRFDTNNLGVRTHGTHFLDGDVHFANDGHTDGILWDKSGSSMRWKDNNKALYGDGEDLKIYHDGSNSYVQDSGTGNLIIAGSAVNILNAAASESMIRASENGAVELYHDNSKKFETVSYGAAVSGIFTSTGDIKTMNDTAKFISGASDDLEIYHNGTHSFVSDVGTGSLLVTTNGTGIFLQKGTSETLAKFLTDGAVELNYDDVKRFETLSDGVNVTGTLKVNGSALSGGKCIKQLATFTQNAFNTTDSAFSDVISVDYTPASSSSLIVFDFTAANSTVGNSSGGSATLGIRLMKDSTTLINATNATDFAVGNGEPDRISSSLLVRHMEGNSNTNQRTYKARFNREAGNTNATLSNGLGIIIREYAS